MVRGFARRKIGGGGDPEDVVQETLLVTHLKHRIWREGAPVRPALTGAFADRRLLRW
jgi:DNA-directed RNA polymerase specialized sigma24 family protein